MKGHRTLRVILALVAAVVAVVACTTAATPAPAPASRPAASKPAARAVAAVQPRAVAGIALTSAVQPIPTASRHSAFPGLAKAPDGSLTLVWRGATDHEDARDGAIKMASSRDGGQTYSGETTVLSGQDYRDPSVSYIDGHEFLTYFTGSSSNGAEGAYVIRDRDTGHPVRIDGGLPWAAISAPVMKLPDGRLATSFYGRKAGESLATAWIAYSTDGGVSWATNRIINSGIATPEPWLVVDGAQVHMFARWGGDAIAVRSSADSGKTWGAVRVVVTDCSGRPTTYRTTAGTLVMICRGPLSSGKHAKAVYSLNGGANWNVGPTVMYAPAGSPNGMTYAAMVEIHPGVLYTVVGMEQPDGSSALWGAYLAESVQ